MNWVYLNKKYCVLHIRIYSDILFDIGPLFLKFAEYGFGRQKTQKKQVCNNR